MRSVLNKPIVLVLNSLFMGVGVRTVRKAITSLCGCLPGQTAPAMAVVVDYPEVGDGLFDLTKPKVIDRVSWDEWVKLPVRPCDLGIASTSGPVRVPVAIIEPEFYKMPTVLPRLSKRNILERDGYRCQYTGQVLPPEELDIDHVIPRSHGGKNTWENMVASARRINQMKGNRLNHEVGLRLIRKPREPKRIPICASIARDAHPSWAAFLGDVAA